jgi:hypothetical protein
MPDMSDSALRCLLGVIHLSFRLDPNADEWTHSGDWFSRSDVESECGLSSQGARNGLDQLESIGWMRVDRSSRSHQYRLRLEVPTRRFTYIPTTLLEDAGKIDSGTELRVVLAVLRGTWGWTQKETDPQSGSLRVAHDRWTQLANGELATVTGRSETAVGEAAAALQGKWIERVRPGNGPHQYRFLPDATVSSPGDEDALDANSRDDGSCDDGSSCGSTSNNLTPDRQKSGTPTFNKESFSRDKHSQLPKETDQEGEVEGSRDGDGAVPSRKQPSGEKHRTQTTGKGPSREPPNQSTGPDFGDLPSEKRDLAEKLQNVGVWAGRIAEFLSRFSTARIRANFELYRQRAARQTIHNSGAWLSQAIVEGYALPTDGSEESSLSSSTGSLPPLEHKQTISESEKESYVAQGVSEERFHRCLSGRKDATGPRFMYFAPDSGGPSARR